MTTTNQTLLDLNKVQHGTFWWVNEFGHKSRLKPKATHCGEAVHGVTDANRHKLDTWRPLVVFQLTANHNITYTGDKAQAMWKAWREKIFNK